MNTIIVTEKSTGNKVYDYQSHEPIEWYEYPFSLYDHNIELEVVSTPNIVEKWLTKQDFLDKFGSSAVAFILSAAKTSIEVEMWIKRLDLTTPNPDGTSVNLSDPRTIAGVNSLGSILIANNIVPEGWIEEVLS